MIGTGFLKTLFAAGMLDTVDVSSFTLPHACRRLDVELTQLNAAMDAAGKHVPIWASEFSLDSRDQSLAAGELVKQTTMLAAQGAAQAQWYALIDQRWFPNMGLDAGNAPRRRRAPFAD
jgi:thioester reductase-like protein